MSITFTTDKTKIEHVFYETNSRIFPVFYHHGQKLYNNSIGEDLIMLSSHTFKTLVRKIKKT